MFRSQIETFSTAGSYRKCLSRVDVSVSETWSLYDYLAVSGISGIIPAPELRNKKAKWDGDPDDVDSTCERRTGCAGEVGSPTHTTASPRQ